MLNPTFPKAIKNHATRSYVINDQLARDTVFGNQAFDTGPEYRLQAVYGDEIWKKLERAGLPASKFEQAKVLEVCAGTGFLTHHLLRRFKPRNFTVNDISPTEIQAAQDLLSRTNPEANISWVIGDMHEIDFSERFDVIIGNSFLHHFHDVPKVLSRFAELLTEDGVFVSLHEPTPMATVVEGAKLLAYPLAVMFPSLVNDIARARYKGPPSQTDIWMFESKSLEKVALNAGFSNVQLVPWHFFRPILVQQQSLHLGSTKTELSPNEIETLDKAVRIDSKLNRFLPSRFFGSICLVCHK